MPGCTSASSRLDFWVKSFQLHAGIFDAELPIDTALFGVRLVGPGAPFRVQCGQFTDATSPDALARQAAPLAFRAMQPAAVFGGGAQFDPFHGRPRQVRVEGFRERACGVRVEVVAHECPRRAIGIARLPEVCACDRPVGLSPACAGGRLSATRARFGHQEKAGRTIAVGGVIHTRARHRRRGDRHPRFLEYRARLFVHTPHRRPCLVRFRVGFEYVFPPGQACGGLLRRHHPVCDLPFGPAIVLSVLRTVS